MKKEICEIIEIPSGISCEYRENVLTCSNGQIKISREINVPKLILKIENNQIKLECKKGNKNDYKKIKSQCAHIRNIFRGLKEKYTYQLEVCNVHFPMTLKIDNSKLIINNFLGEKTPRVAEILPNVEVQIKGQQIIVSSHDKEAAGKTVSNIERATKITGRDRRIYQDGIFLVARPGGSR